MSLFLLVLFFFPFVSHAERIKEFSTIMSNTASSSSAFNVSESIQYDFEGTSRHGIYRTIPLINLDGSKLTIDTIRVTDAAGEKQIPFATE